MGNFRYQPPPGSEFRALVRSDALQGQLEDVARGAKAHAESIAPVKSGDYRDSFRVERTKGGGVWLINDDPAAVAIEFGSEDTEAHYVLSRTVDWIERGGT